MQRFALALAALWLGAGCCDQCPALGGAYEASFEQQTEGVFVCSRQSAKPAVVVSFNPPQVPSDCQAEVKNSEGDCRTKFEVHCLERGHTESWDIEWSCDGESGDGSFSVSDGGGDWCSFWYDVTLQKLQ